MLRHRDYTWPYSVGRVFYGSGDGRGDGSDGLGEAQVIVQSGSGGIITGDRLHQRFSTGPGAWARVLGQGAMSVHRVGSGSRGPGAGPGSGGSGEDLELFAAAGSRLESLAEPRVLFGGSDFSQRTAIETSGDGVALSVEAVVLNEAGEGVIRYSSEVEVRCEGELLARERMRLTDADLPSGMTAFALLVIAGWAAPASVWGAWSADVGGRALYGTAGELPFGAGTAVRLVAADGRQLRLGIESALAVTRSADKGKRTPVQGMLTPARTAESDGSAGRAAR